MFSFAGIIASTRAYLGISAAPEGDPFYDDVILLVRSVGATDTQSTFVDESVVGRTLTDAGGVIYSNTQSKFEDTAMFFDGSNNEVTMPNATDMQFDDRTVEFCMEAWIWIDDTVDEHTILSGRDLGSAEEWVFRTHLTDQESLIFALWDSGGSAILSATTDAVLVQNQWHHVAVVRQNVGGDGVITIYVDGVSRALTGTTTQTTDGDTNTSGYQIGGNLADGTRFFDGYIDSVRVTKNNPRYRHDFPVPTLSFPASSVVSTYSTQVFADTPCGYWQMNEASGNLIDDIHGNDLVPSNITYEEDPVTQTVDTTSVSFDGAAGSGAELIPSTSDVQIIGDLTLEVWFESLGNATTNRHLLLCSYDGETEAQNYCYSLGISDTGEPRYFHEYSAGTNFSVEGNIKIPENTWIHMVMVRDTTAKTVDVYINGVFSEQLTYTNNATGGGETGILLGNTPTNGGRFDGRMDNFAVYDYMMSAERIAAHYTTTSKKLWYQTILDKVPVGWWRLNEESGDLSIDETGNGNHVTWSGSTLEDGLVLDEGSCREILGASTDGAVLATPSSDLLILGDMTFECWVNLTSFNSGNKYIVVFGGVGDVDGTENWAYGFGHNSSGVMRSFHEYSASGTNVILTSGGSMPTNQLVHLAYVRDISAHSVTFYMNGQISGSAQTWSASADPTDASAGELWIGRQVSVGAAIDGQIDEIAIFDQALTAAEVYDHYNQGFGLQDAFVPFTAIGLEDLSILDGAIDSSANYAGYDDFEGRLGTPGGDATEYWAAAIAQIGDTWWVDLGSKREVGAFASQGSTVTAGNEFITSYKLQYSDNASDWTEYNSDENLTGNTTKGDVVKNILIPFEARYVRLEITGYSSWPSGRFEVYARDI